MLDRHLRPDDQRFYALTKHCALSSHFRPCSAFILFPGLVVLMGSSPQQPSPSVLMTVRSSPRPNCFPVVPGVPQGSPSQPAMSWASTQDCEFQSQVFYFFCVCNPPLSNPIVDDMRIKIIITDYNNDQSLGTHSGPQTQGAL